MAKLKINLQDLIFAFLNDDPDLDPHLNLENGELIDNSSTYYSAPPVRVKSDEEDEEEEAETEAGKETDSEEHSEEEEEGYDEIVDFDKFVRVKSLSAKGHHNILQEFINGHDLANNKELCSLKNIKDFEYKVKSDAKLHEKWQLYKTEKFKFIAARWMELNKVRADLI